MIITKLIGGLGNQMFQYATGRSLAHRNNDSLKIDLSGYKNQIGVTPREYELSIFNINEVFSNTSEISRLKRWNIISNLFFKNSRKLYLEEGFRFNKKFCNLKGDIVLSGFWNSEKYFKDIETLLRKDFEFKKPINSSSIKILEQILHSNSVAVHIRRGDYVKDKKTNEFHGICDLNYYNKAMIIMEKKVKNIIYFVFSDDMDWARQNLKNERQMVFVDGNKGMDSWMDMALMSRCKHNIIANSTFSWWGAWLNNNGKKLVLAPNKWFNNTTLDTRDLIPKEWTKI